MKAYFLHCGDYGVGHAIGYVKAATPGKAKAWSVGVCPCGCDDEEKFITHRVVRCAALDDVDFESIDINNEAAGDMEILAARRLVIRDYYEGEEEDLFSAHPQKQITRIPCPRCHEPQHPRDLIGVSTSTIIHNPLALWLGLEFVICDLCHLKLYKHPTPPAGREIPNNARV